MLLSVKALLLSRNCTQRNLGGVMKALAESQVAETEHSSFPDRKSTSKKTRQDMARSLPDRAAEQALEKETSQGRFLHSFASQGHWRASTSLDAKRRRRRGYQQICLATSCEMTSEWCAQRRANVSPTRRPTAHYKYCCTNQKRGLSPDL